ncbi:MAG: MFS transporter [Actinomycetales bacterium]|nr:MFS transporter [Actinomycetales bacterium]
MNGTQRLVVVIAVLASFVSFLDGVVVNVALPAIEADLGGGLTTQQWAVDAYLVTLGSLILIAGSLSDAFGRVRVLTVGLLGFGATSLFVALAWDPTVLIFARALQGVAGALLVPSSLALITSRISGPAQSRAIGVWTAFTTVAMLIGPFLGGAFVDLLSWRWVFVINVVPIAVTLLLLPRIGTEPAPAPGTRIDLLGAALCTFGLAGLVVALIEQPDLGWGHPVVWAGGGLGVLLLAGFLWRQRVAPRPIMPLDLFRVRNFWTGNLATLFIYAALSLQGFVLVVWLQQGAELPATLAGVAALPATLLMILLSSRVGALAGRWGPRAFMTVGPIVAGIGTALLLNIRLPFDYWWQVLPGVLVFGLGLTLTVSPLTSAILGSIDPARSGIASAVNNAVSRVAGLLVIAMIAAIIGGRLDVDGLHRALLVCSVLLVAGGVVSFFGIRNEHVRGHAGSAEDGDAAGAGDAAGDSADAAAPAPSAEQG